jgi:hypothetical protein
MYDFYHRVLVKQFEVRGKSTTLNFTFTFAARAVSKSEPQSITSVCQYTSSNSKWLMPARLVEYCFHRLLLEHTSPDALGENRHHPMLTIPPAIRFQDWLFPSNPLQPPSLGIGKCSYRDERRIRFGLHARNVCLWTPISQMVQLAVRTPLPSDRKLTMYSVPGGCHANLPGYCPVATVRGDAGVLHVPDDEPHATGRIFIAKNVIHAWRFAYTGIPSHVGH